MRLAPGDLHGSRIVSRSWQDDPFALDDVLDDAAFEQPAEDSQNVQASRRRRAGRTALLIAVASLAVVTVSLVMGASDAGRATVAVGAVAYVLALASDLRQRRARRSKRRYGRPWATALLRLVVFWAAIGAVWLAASGLAGA